MTTEVPGNIPLNAGLCLEPLAPLVERLLKYSDIRCNDPRESREALRDLILGELADELRAMQAAERERCAALCESTYPEWNPDDATFQKPCFDTPAECAAAIRGA